MTEQQNRPGGRSQAVPEALIGAEAILVCFLALALAAVKDWRWIR